MFIKEMNECMISLVIQYFFFSISEVIVCSALVK